MFETRQIINGIEYIRRELTDRLIIMFPVERKPLQPKAFNLRKVLLKAGVNTCADCGAGEDLQAHHKDKIKYLKTNKGHYHQDPSADHSLSNGVMLCRSCHLKRHKSK